MQFARLYELQGGQQVLFTVGLTNAQYPAVTVSMVHPNQQWMQIRFPINPEKRDLVLNSINLSLADALYTKLCSLSDDQYQKYLDTYGLMDFLDFLSNNQLLH